MPTPAERDDKIGDKLINGAIDSFKHGYWPNPFHNLVKELHVLACQKDGLMVYVRFFTGAAVQWAFSTFVPSPWELGRKFIGGGYRCGFYVGIHIKSPLTALWHSEDFNEFLFSFTRPITESLFYMWAFQSEWSFFSTMQSVIYAIEACDEDANGCLVGDAVGAWSEGYNYGPPGLGVEIYDNLNAYTYGPLSFEIHRDWGYSVASFGRIEARSYLLENVKIHVSDLTDEVTTIELGTILPYEIKPWSIGGSGICQNGIITINLECDATRVAGVLPPGIFAVRTIIHADPNGEIPFSYPLFLPSNGTYDPCTWQGFKHSNYFQGLNVGVL